MNRSITFRKLSAKTTVLVSILCLVPGFASANDTSNCESAKQVVEKYIALDLLGEGTYTSKKMRRLIDYQGRDTPGWDSFVLTSRSRVQSCKASGSHVMVSIVHEVYGTVDAADGAGLKEALSKPLTADETFLRLNRTAHGWKIDSPSVYPPHVGVAAAGNLFKRR
jgi:hypothetical protein